MVAGMPGGSNEKRTIARAAKQAGVHVETIRYYERIGLLPRKGSGGGYRVYSEDDVRRIRFVRNCQAYGFSLREIAGLLNVRENANATCDDVCVPAQQKIEEIEEKIRALIGIRDELRRLTQCSTPCLPIEDCQLIKEAEERE